MGENKKSLANLFVDLLRYYATFSWDHHVVSIRHNPNNGLLDKFDKMWVLKKACIEGIDVHIITYCDILNVVQLNLYSAYTSITVQNALP